MTSIQTANIKSTAAESILILALGLNGDFLYPQALISLLFSVGEFYTHQTLQICLNCLPYVQRTRVRASIKYYQFMAFFSV